MMIVPEIIKPPPLWCPPRGIERCRHATFPQPNVHGNRLGSSAPSDPFELTHEATAVNPANNQSSYTFSSVSLGADVSGGNVRYSVVMVGVALASGSTQSCTIAGVAATRVTDGTTTATAGPHSYMCDIWIADTSGLGTTGNVVVGLQFASSRGGGISVNRLINPSAAQAYAVTVDTTDSSGLIDLSLNVPTDGKALAATQQRDGGTNTWVGLTEHLDSDLDVNEYFSAALGGGVGTPLTVTAQSADTTPADMKGVSASWGPA